MSNASKTSPGFVDPLTTLRRLFYVVSPWETSFETVDRVPQFVEEAVPYFILLVLVELAILTWQNRGDRIPLSDSLGSLSGGIFSQLPLLLARSIEVSTYIWVYENWRLFDAPWDSPLSWFLVLFGVDLGYYWAHRLAHEVNLFWSGHQMHHSSQRYNLTTALRQSVLQRYFSWFFYLPMALALPPSLYLVHIQFNLIYQFWIHTELIDKLPWPIELVMNTPSHHRVHHGRNSYCIDKNYAGTFIIFDRIFGTFEPEHDDDRPVYGLVHPVQTLDPLELQLFHLRYVWQLWQKQATWSDSLKAVFYGPGWQPGLPRLGDGQFPEIERPVRFFEPDRPKLATAYAYVHFILSVLAYGFMAARRAFLPYWSLLLGCCLVVLTMSTVARIVERFGRATLSLELLRCLCVASFFLLLRAGPVTTGISVFYFASAIFCLAWRRRVGAGDKKIK